MSKGSGRRPQQEDDKKVASEWDRLFGKAMDKSIKDTFGDDDIKIVTYGKNDVKRLNDSK